jgi:hypothetical protein
VNIALKSSYIGYLASDVRRAEELSSPPMVRRLFLGRKEEGAPLKLAVKKVGLKIQSVFRTINCQTFPHSFLIYLSPIFVCS